MLQSLGKLGDLAGLRVAVGPPGSGTLALSERLLRDNGVHDGSKLSDLGGQPAIDALRRGELDAVFLVMSAKSPLIDSLLRDPNLRPFDFARAAAYTRRYRFLNDLVLPEGVVDLADEDKVWFHFPGGSSERWFDPLVASFLAE